MAQPRIQTSFNSGEWAPALNARVDLAKYHSGAALLRNFFVDYRGGATSRGGTRYILQAFKSTTAVRLIPFQASFTVSYVLEFGDLYVRFFTNGAPVLETPIAITAATKANPAVLSVVNTHTVNDWIYVTGVVGMTQLNGNYYIISARTGTTITLANLDGTAVNSTAYTTYTSGGTVARVYTLTSPYAATELALLKFAQNVSDLIICHPNHPPYKLSLISAASWTLAAITFGSTVPTVGSVVVTTTLAAGSCNYAYIVTAVDENGQESAASAFGVLASVQDIRITAGTNTVTWAASTSAVEYYVYRAEIRYGSAVPAGSSFGFVGSCTALTFIDSNIIPDFSSTQPVIDDPFAGTGVQSVTITAPGIFNGGVAFPTVAFTASPSITATGTVVLEALDVTLVSGGDLYLPNDTITLINGVIIQVVTVAVPNSYSAIATFTIINRGNLPASPIPSNPQPALATSGTGINSTFTIRWRVASITITNPGFGYVGAPTPTISGSSGATATSTLGAGSAGNPTVPQLAQQRLILAGPIVNPQRFNGSQPGSYYNYNIHSPLQPDSAITGTLVSGQLNTIKAMLPQPQGLMILSDKQAWLLNGGSPGSAFTAIDITANAQAFNGISDVPPVVANDHILYVQSKGSIVRDLAFNFGTQVYTGTDISVISSHLFYGFNILEWAWCEEPFKLCWAVRNDGTLLSLTFLKEQELIAWAHSDTNGAFKSVATVTETVVAGTVDALYTCVQRTIGGTAYKYIERMTELYYPTGVADAFCVDAGIAYSGTAVTTFSGAQHLRGLSCTGLADGIIIPTFTMAANGSFTLATAASKVVVGLAYTPQLQTLSIDLGEPTIQGKMKKIPAVTVRVNATLGLQIGGDFDNLVDMDDLIRGNIGKDTNALITDLVTGDALQTVDPAWTVPGQYCIQQTYPYPASILGVIPQLAVGDTKDKRT